MKRSPNYAYTWRWGWKWVWFYIRWRPNPAAVVRQIYWTFVRGYQGEACQFCGRPYVLWGAPDALWIEVMGSPGGLSCPSCFDRRADKRGVCLYWTPELWEDYLSRTKTEHKGKQTT